jgi:CubicO group peptidase (beta-lactamase class C family)
VCTARACISVSRLADSIAAQLKGSVVGYVALVGTSKVVSSGLARTAADPPKLAMGPDVTVNVASVGKMFTTIAVLQSLARHHLSTCNRIWPFLPDWVKGPGVGTITFGDLLAPGRVPPRQRPGLPDRQRGEGTNQARRPTGGQAGGGL